MLDDLILYIGFIILLLFCAYPLGMYMHKVFNMKKSLPDLLLEPVANTIYRLVGIDKTQEMNWKEYARNIFALHIIAIIAVFFIQLIQGWLPLNPANLAAPSWHLALNTAVSFVTNTNWQAYSGETTLSYFTQMTALTVQNFLSAATGLSVAVALMRGLTRKNSSTIGNFWVDLTRGTLWILLPLSILFSLIFVQQGVIQNFGAYIQAHTLEGALQTIPMGPVASQEAIKLLGTNGGGFFGANSAHPFENPTAISNLLQAFAILLIPVATLFTYGRFTGDSKQGAVILSSMILLFILMLTLLYTAETALNPKLKDLSIIGAHYLEGKEFRFGITGSALFSAVTTAASCGAVNSMLDSMSPIGGLAALLQMMLGEVNIGGIGAGFYGMILYVLFTVFIVGLMVGRTPEYLGKKIEAREIKMAILAILIPSLTILIGSALTILTKIGLSSMGNPGPHGLTELLYAFTSAAVNNGSAFGGLSVNNVFFNLVLALVMFIGRLGVIIPVLAIAGNMAQKRSLSSSVGTFSTTSLLFVFLLSGIVLVIGALTFVPALALGPILERLLM